MAGTPTTSVAAAGEEASSAGSVCATLAPLPTATVPGDAAAMAEVAVAREQ